MVEFDGPVLELMTESRTRFDLRLAALGPDILAAELDEARFLRRLREDDPTRGIGDALLDQRNIAGIGNVWKSEGCFDAGIDPWRRVATSPTTRCSRSCGATRARMQDSVSRGGHIRGSRSTNVPGGHARAADADPRTRPGRRQPDDLLVSRVPALKRVGHKGADHVAPGNTRESFEAALEHGVDMIEFDVLRLRDGRLVLAHDYEDAAKRTPLTLDEGLDLFAGEAYAGVELDVDLKLPGYEREVVEGLARARARRSDR